MPRQLLTSLVLLSALARGQDAPKPFQCQALQFEVGLPEGLEAQQDRTLMVARTRNLGFMVSREPFLHTEKGFGDAWGTQLSAAGIDTKVTTGKVLGHVAFHAAWKAGEAGRAIQVWRIHVPVNEMLYNFSFSAQNAEDLEPLVDRVLKSFRCTAPSPTLKFQKQAISLGPRASARLPEGYEQPGRGQEIEGALPGSHVRILPGYAKPHVAGSIVFRGYDARVAYRMPDGSLVPGGNVKKLVQLHWDNVKGTLGKVVKRPRLKPARYGGFKGASLSASVVTADGLAKRFLAFGAKLKTSVVVAVILVDEREARLHKDYLKQIWSHIEVKE